MVITKERLCELLEYNPETGDWHWLQDRQCVGAGEIAGGVLPRTGYRLICVDYKNYAAHRLAWLYMTGGWPKGVIDHINLDRADNRWINLRDVSPRENAMNSVQTRRDQDHPDVVAAKARNYARRNRPKSTKLPPILDPLERLYANFQVNELSGCWNWTGRCFELSSYGVFKCKALAPHNIAASRASWIIHNGPIPDGLFVCHECDNRKCVNPSHLFLGTCQDNMRDASAKGRINKPS